MWGLIFTLQARADFEIQAVRSCLKWERFLDIMTLMAVVEYFA
jgi:hypothetical protein